MKRITILISMLLILILADKNLFSQQTDSNDGNALQKFIESEGDERLSWGAYGQIVYSHRVSDSLRYNGIMNVHRFVTFMGYKFSNKTHLVAEIEYEHVNELYIEQVYVNHQILPWLNFRGGLMLIPMGIINEYHEPTTFNGVARPIIDNTIVPTTWRELGAGFAGKFDNLSLRYQLYMVNGFLSYKDGAGLLQGSNALRNGRQKGIRSVFTHPNYSAKINYYGLPKLMFGLSGYTGKTQSTAFHNSPSGSNPSADSTVVKVDMVGLDAEYKIKNFDLRAQYIYGKIGNTEQYNAKTGRDLGSNIYGFYIDASYDFLKSETQQLRPFVRYEKYDTHASTKGGLARNKAYEREAIISGISYHPVEGVAFKADLMLDRNANRKTFAKTINAGIGIWF